jgi:hypothetical protein
MGDLEIELSEFYLKYEVTNPWSVTALCLG